MSLGWLVVVLGTIAAAVDLVVARRFMAVMPEDLVRKPDPHGRTAAQLNLAGRILAAAGFGIFAVSVAIGFGLIPTGIEPASLGGAS